MLKSSDKDSHEAPWMVPHNDIPVPFCIVDSNGFLRTCNELFLDLIGYSAQQVSELSFEALAAELPKNQIHLTLGQIQASPGLFAQRVWLKRKDGSVFPAVMNVNAYKDARGEVLGAHIVVIDDTYNYRAMSWAEKDKEEMKRKDRLKDEFVAIASHELRTPIQPILGFALLAKRGSITNEAAWEGVLQEARRLQQLANDILDVSRIESGSLRYELAKLKINEIIQHAVDSFGAELNKDVRIIFENDPPNSDVVIEADRTRITQALTNLIGNAVKFTDKGIIRIESKPLIDRNSIEITITDTGGGIDSEVIPRLFEKFVTKGHGEGVKKGTGLGLYITKAIITAHGGEISAYNNRDGGATFKIVLPGLTRNSHNGN